VGIRQAASMYEESRGREFASASDGGLSMSIVTAVAVLLSAQPSRSRVARGRAISTRA